MKKIFLLFALSLLFFSCKKDDKLTCENWDVEDYVIPVPGYVYSTPYVQEMPVCGDDLNYAHSGKDKLLNKSPTGNTMRKYIRKVN